MTKINVVCLTSSPIIMNSFITDENIEWLLKLLKSWISHINNVLYISESVRTHCTWLVSVWMMWRVRRRARGLCWSQNARVAACCSLACSPPSHWCSSFLSYSASCLLIKVSNVSALNINKHAWTTNHKFDSLVIILSLSLIH